MVSPGTGLPSSGHTHVIVEALPGWAEDPKGRLVLSGSFVRRGFGEGLASACGSSPTSDWLVPALGPPLAEKQSHFLLC